MNVLNYVKLKDQYRDKASKLKNLKGQKITVLKPTNNTLKGGIQ